MSSDDHQPKRPSSSQRARVRACARTIVDRSLAFLLTATGGGGGSLCLLLLPPLALLVVHLSSDIHERGVRAQRRTEESVSGERGDGRVSGRLIKANQPAQHPPGHGPTCGVGRPSPPRARAPVASPPPPPRRAAIVPHSARLTTAPNLAAHLIDELVGVNQAHTELTYGRVGVLALGPRRKTNVRHRRVGRCPRLRARGARLRAGGGLLG